MSAILQVISVLWKVYAGLILGISLLLFYPVHLALLNNEKTLGIGFNVIRFQAGLILLLIGVIPRIKFQGKLPEGPFIICPNHTSYLDILLMYRVFPQYFIFIGKRELETDLIFRIFFKKMNILVKRDSAMDGMRALNQAGVELRKGTRVVIFPEGTIPDHAPELMPFKSGPFRLAIKEQVPIVPVTMINVYKLLQIGAFLRRRGKPGVAHITVNTAIETKGMNERDLIPLRDQISDTISQTIRAHYANR